MGENFQISVREIFKIRTYLFASKNEIGCTSTDGRDHIREERTQDVAFHATYSNYGSYLYYFEIFQLFIM